MQSAEDNEPVPIASSLSNSIGQESKRFHPKKTFHLVEMMTSQNTSKYLSSMIRFLKINVQETSERASTVSATWLQRVFVPP